MGPRPTKRVTKPKDTDGDGLSDAEEKKFGSSISSKDSDSDGIDDKDEFFFGSNPTQHDTDHDGLSDRAEQLLGTKANEADSDGDGISDGVEVAYGTSPTNTISMDSSKKGHIDDATLGAERAAMREKVKGRDSDGDGLDDDFERKYGLDPNSQDSDMDGLGDRVEVLRGTDPTWNDSDYDDEWNDLGDVLRHQAPDRNDIVAPGQYRRVPWADSADAADGPDRDSEIAGFISDDHAQRLADMRDAELGMDVLPPSVRAAMGLDDVPGETPEIAPPPEDVEILDHDLRTGLRRHRYGSRDRDWCGGSRRRWDPEPGRRPHCDDVVRRRTAARERGAIVLHGRDVVHDRRTDRLVRNPGNLPG